MKDFLTAVESTVQKYQMTAPGQKVLCALSGGVDSVCMTHALAALRGRLGIVVCAAHFSHGIRPGSAQSERSLALRLCASLGIDLLYEAGDIPALARERGLSLEEAARIARYDFLRRAAQRSGSDRIATAHHRDDNCETVLLNLIRGSGTVGLGGIPPVRGGIIRPLIACSRAQIEEYAVQNGLRWAQDESNFDQSVPRNRLRHTVMPALRQINPQADACMARASELARLDGEYLLECARALADQAQLRGGEVSIAAGLLAKAHPAVSGRAIRLLYVRAGGREGAFTLRHAQAVLDLCAAECPSASADLPGGICAARRYEALVFSAAAGKETLPCLRLTRGVPVQWGEWTLCFAPANPESWPMTAWLAAEGTENGLFVRPRAEGDIIDLPGGRKSLKKFMIDRKIPQKDRDRTPVLCDNKKVRAIFWDRAYTAEKEGGQAVAVAARRNER